MGTYLLVAAIVLAVAMLTQKWWTAWLGLSAANTATVNKVAALLDEAAFIGALTPAYLLALKRGDQKIKDLLGECRVAAAAWDDVPTPPVVVVPPTIEQRIAALESSGKTSTVPAASTSGA